MTFALAIAATASVFAQDAQTAAENAAAELIQAADTPAPAPKVRYWTNSLQTSINFGQTALVNWSAGGYNNLTLAAYVDANANYARRKFKWDNRLQLDYGFLYSADKPIIQKNKDRIYLQSNAALDTPVKNLYYSADFSFKTQFNSNYNYVAPILMGDEDNKEIRKAWKDARELTMTFFSPAYINLGLGIKWTPAKWLTVNFAPLTGGVVVVGKSELRSTYSMDIKKKYKDQYDERNAYVKDNEADYAQALIDEIAGTATDEQKTLITNWETYSDWLKKGDYYRSTRFELGTQVKADIKVDVNDNFTYSSQVVVFYNYLKPKQVPRISWDNRVFWKMAKYFSLTLSTNLIYDPEVNIPYLSGTKKQKAKMDELGTRTFKGVQFKEFLELGFTYTIATKK